MFSRGGEEIEKETKIFKFIQTKVGQQFKWIRIVDRCDRGIKDY
jgi:hypothetical protein